jgi:hypothetical protein
MTICWVDQFERAYARLAERDGYWWIALGYRDPPGNDNLIQQGERLISDRDEAVAWRGEQVRMYAPGLHVMARPERELTTLGLLTEGRER